MREKLWRLSPVLDATERPPGSAAPAASAAFALVEVDQAALAELVRLHAIAEGTKAALHPHTLVGLDIVDWKGDFGKARFYPNAPSLAAFRGADMVAVQLDAPHPLPPEVRVGHATVRVERNGFAWEARTLETQTRLRTRRIGLDTLRKAFEQ